jgi:SnoaL-like polyketide cyclase
MSTQEEQNKAAVRRFCDVMNTGDAGLMSKAIDEMVEPNALIRTPLPLETTGAEKLKEVFARLHMGVSPTGTSVTYDEIFVFRFAGGRIAETWGVVDVVSQLRQLGVSVRPAPSL